MSGEMQKPSDEFGVISTLKQAGNTVQNLLNAGSDGVVGKGVEIGVSAVLAKTVLKRLPVPLNFLAPWIVERLILQYGVDGAREMLLRGLYWVKNATEDEKE